MEYVLYIFFSIFYVITKDKPKYCKGNIPFELTIGNFELVFYPILFTR
jgi:hypothetical protein